MVTTTLYARQQKRHRYEEQTFGLCGRRRGWNDLREQHWNMYITVCETDDQSKFDAWNRALKASALGQPRGMGCGEKWKRGSGWGGTHVHSWLIHVSVWSWKMGTWKLIIIFFLLVCVYTHIYIHIFITNCLQQTFFRNTKKKEKEIKTGHHSKDLKKWSLKHMELDIVSHKLSSF